MGNTSNGTSLEDEPEIDLSELLTKSEADNMRNLIKYHIHPKSFGNNGYSHTSSSSSSNNEDFVTINDFIDIMKGSHPGIHDGIVR